MFPIRSLGSNEQKGFFMKIGIFVHSQSGNTAKLGLAVVNALREKGHDVSIELLRPVGKVHPRMRHVEFRTLPETEEYDMVLFGGPIWAFHASPVVVSLLKQISTLKGKKALCFTTSGFPTAFSGAKRAIMRINELLEGLGATVLTGIPLFWGMYCGKKKLDKTVEEICGTILK
jgi:NAD(P)H dehydrogenase (quinone)